ncbi:unnamed protein product, partial [Effrenium voratum]
IYGFTDGAKPEAGRSMGRWAEAADLRPKRGQPLFVPDPSMSAWTSSECGKLQAAQLGGAPVLDRAKALVAEKCKLQTLEASMAGLAPFSVLAVTPASERRRGSFL